MDIEYLNMIHIDTDKSEKAIKKDIKNKIRKVEKARKKIIQKRYDLFYVALIEHLRYELKGNSADITRFASSKRLLRKYRKANSDFLHGINFFVNRDYRSASDAFRNEAELGNEVALYIMAFMMECDIYIFQQQMTKAENHAMQLVLAKQQVGYDKKTEKRNSILWFLKRNWFYLTYGIILFVILMLFGGNSLGSYTRRAKLENALRNIDNERVEGNSIQEITSAFATVIVDKGNVRKKPGTNNDIIDSVSRGDELVLTGNSENVNDTKWYEVYIDFTYVNTGWVSEKIISIN